jgi:hypothetical protein
VACFHCEPVSPNTVAPRIDYSPVLQQEWLRQELQELAKVWLTRMIYRWLGHVPLAAVVGNIVIVCIQIR